MDKRKEVNISKFLSLVLRHSPQTLNLVLDENGWADIEELLAKCNQKGVALNRDQLNEIVANNDKQRFAFNQDGSRIRASQGHSVKVNLAYQPTEPPEILYHGTAIQHVDSIRQKGLLKGNRHHVHLSPAVDTAQKVGSRHGKPLVLTIRAGQMWKDGLLFFRSENGVWLTDYVHPQYIDFGKS